MDSDLKGRIGVQGLRARAPVDIVVNQLGALKDLPGFWQGTGFGLISRPYFGPNAQAAAEPGGRPPMFLQLNLLQEVLEISSIGSPVVNRGSVQDDVALYGVTYLHRVTDATIGGALHIEPGMWLNVPGDAAAGTAPAIARLATIPHGDAFCANGFVEEAVFDRIPEIPPINTIPYPQGAEPPAPGAANPFPEFNLAQGSEQRTSPLPCAITQALIDDPNQMLRDVLYRQVNGEGKTLKRITRLITQTSSGADVANIPFIKANANAVDVMSVFAIEEVVDPNGYEFIQLQYVQSALLQFGGWNFPHVTVGTLIKSF